MDQAALTTIAKRLVAIPKGILAIDESTQTCTKRFEKLGIESTEENRRQYRELLITTANIEHYISGMIMVEETLRQKTTGGVPFIDIFREKHMDMGIKVDRGTKPLALHDGETITEGLDGLRERLKEYKSLGATFTKWRAMFRISFTTPSDAAISHNVRALTEYAALVQEAGMVPIVEPEVLMDGDHTIDEAENAISKILDALFRALVDEGVYLPGLILKTGMVIPGQDCPEQATPGTVAERTLKCLKTHVPADIGGIVFLSGGQGEMEATLNLNAMHEGGALPWPLTFSYGRAIQNPALQTWAKDIHSAENSFHAQELLLQNAKADSEASVGTYHHES